MHPTIGADQRVHQVALKVKLKRNDIQNVLNNSYDSHQNPSLKNWRVENSQSICTILSQNFFILWSQPQKIKIKIKNVPC